MKKILFCLLCVLSLSQSLIAYDFSEEEFSYNILSEEDATVVLAKGTAPTKSNYWPLPSTVMYNGKKYTVTEIGERAITNISTRDLEIEIPESIQRIGDYGISSCWYMYWITIKDSEEPLYVGKGFLSGCSSIETAEIYRQIVYPEGASPAFKGKGKLKDVYIRGGYHNINTQEFQSCAALEFVSIYTPVYSIGREAFYNTPKLKMFNTYDWDKNYDNIDFVSEMGSGAFEKSGISHAIIPLNLKEIPSSAFANCTNIKNIYFDMYSTTEEIGENAFKGCTSLERVHCYGSLKKIGSSAFDGCTSLKRLDFNYIGCDGTKLLFDASRSTSTFFKDAPIEQIFLDRNIELFNGSLGAYPFEGNTTLTKVTFGENCTVLPMALFRYCESLADINLQDSHLTEIGISCFSGCIGIKGTLRLPETLKVIRTSAFAYCKGIEYADLNDGLTYLGEHCFRGTNIKVAKIPGTVTEMHNAFVDCTDLTSCTFDDGTEAIAFSGNPFKNCPLTTLTLGRNIMPWGKTFGGAMAKSVAPFKGNTTLKELYITDAVTDIPSETFYECTSLVFIQYYGYSNIETIGAGAFYNCSALTEFTVPSTVKSIGDFCFNGCTNLKNLGFASYPQSSQPVKLAIGNYSNGQAYGMFYQCPLESVVIGRDIDYSNDRHYYAYSPFHGIETIKYVSFSEGVTEVGPYLFENCTGLKGIGIYSPSIKVIHNNAFNGCTNLWYLFLGEGVESIDSYAFTGCPLTQIYSSAVIPPVVTTEVPVFDSDIYANADLKIPEETITSYNTADVWKEFWKVSTMVSDDIFVHRITLDKNELLLTPGMSEILSVAIAPEEAAVKTVLWESSDTDVVRVENGIVTAVSGGSAVITARSTDGSNLKVECMVVVSDVSGVTGIDCDDVSVIVENSKIIVRNVPQGVNVRLIQANGMLGSCITSTGEEITLCPYAKGVYFVIVGSLIYKVIIH